MHDLEKSESASKGISQFSKIIRVLALVLAGLSFLVGLSLLSQSFNFFGQETTTELQKAASNPFIGFFVGILITAILQSSSTTTSFIIAMVASGILGDATDTSAISKAIPIVLGANIGTTVTSTIISLGHIASRKEYRKAIAAATMHDFFNIFTALILFPLELFFGVLSQPAIALANILQPGVGEGGAFGFMDLAIEPVSGGIERFFGMFIPLEFIPLVTIPLSLLLLFLSLRWIIQMLKSNMLQKSNKKLGNAFFQNEWKSLGWGTLLTGLIQSSSVTTSIVVPLVATGRVSMKRAFPFIMGANIGTTTTALVAAIAVTGPNPHAALTIALAHLFFNVIGVLIFFPIAKIRAIPVNLARRLGRATLRNRLVGIVYILLVFFLLPFTMVVLSRSSKYKEVPEKAPVEQVSPSSSSDS